jgi:hypothetical protein
MATSARNLAAHSDGFEVPDLMSSGTGAAKVAEGAGLDGSGLQCGESSWQYLLQKFALGPKAHSCPMDGVSAAHAAAVQRCGGGAVGGARLRARAADPQNFLPLSALSTHVPGHYYRF